jgi:hypothetical protein
MWIPREQYQNCNKHRVCVCVQVISGLKNFNAKSVESVVKAANMGGAYCVCVCVCVCMGADTHV